MRNQKSLLRNPDPIVRTTYLGHLQLFALGAPFMAMVQYSPFLAVRTYNAERWVPALAAILPASHLLAIFFAGPISRSNKVTWVTRPLIVSCLVFGLLVFVDRDHGWMFALIIIAAQSLRSPIISAQSSIFRSNYPAVGRSFALAIPMSIQFIVWAIYSRIGGKLFDRSEDWVVPIFLIAAAFGICGALAFRRVRVREPGPGEAPPASDARIGLGAIVRTLREDRGFFHYQLSYFFFGAGFVAIQAVMPLYLNAEFDANHGQATMVINTIPMLAAALTFPLWGKLLDRVNPLVMRAAINGAWTLTPLLLFLAPSVRGVYLAQLIQGCVFSGSVLIWWLGVNYFARKSEVATYMAVHQTLTGVRGVVTPIVGITIAHAVGYRASMLFWFALMVIGTCIMVAEVMRERRLGVLKTFSEKEAGMEKEAGEAPGVSIPAPLIASGSEVTFGSAGGSKGAAGGGKH